MKRKLKFLKIIKTGQIVRWERYDDATQMFEIILPDETFSMIHQRQTRQITENEELAYLILSGTNPRAVRPVENLRESLHSEI